MSLQAAAALCLNSLCRKAVLATQSSSRAHSRGESPEQLHNVLGCWHSPHLLRLGPWLCKQSRNPWKEKSSEERSSGSGAGSESQPREEEISDAQSVLEHLGSSVLQTAAQQPLSYRVSKGKQRSNLCWSTDLQNLRARGGCAYKHWKIFNFFLHFALLCWGFFPPFCVHVCIFSQGMHAADCTGWGFVWQCDSWLFHLWFQLLNYVVIIWITKYFKAKYFK